MVYTSIKTVGMREQAKHAYSSRGHLHVTPLAGSRNSVSKHSRGLSIAAMATTFHLLSDVPAKLKLAPPSLSHTWVSISGLVEPAEKA